MNRSDFVLYSINNFTWEEIENTGANPHDVSALLIEKLQRFREIVDRPVLLLYNGLTTGNHNNPEHPAGKAADICFTDDKPVSVVPVVKTAEMCGFAGRGTYHNSAAYSFHLDIGKTMRWWSAYKKHSEDKWTYISLINDPAWYSK